MDLFYRTVGEGFPLLILHGLYGASDNWLTMAGKLEDQFKVIIPDLRNHGQSPHDNEMGFDEMKDDILKLMDKLQIDNCYLLGHSMGGKLSMKISFDNPEKIKKLIVVDVAPKSYLEGYSKHFEFHKNVVGLMNGMDLKKFASRREVEKYMIKTISSERIVKFLLKNLKKKGKGQFEWKLNINTIYRVLHNLIDGINVEDTDGNFDNPTLFIRGLKSDYILDEDIPQIEKWFSNLQFVDIADAGHWVHTEQTEKFIEVLIGFLGKSD